MRAQLLRQSNEADEQRKRHFQDAVMLRRMLHGPSRTLGAFCLRNGVHPDCHARHKLLLFRQRKFQPRNPKLHEHHCAVWHLQCHHAHRQTVHRFRNHSCVCIHFQRRPRPLHQRQRVSIDTLPCCFSAVVCRRIFFSRCAGNEHRYHLSVLLRGL